MNLRAPCLCFLLLALTEAVSTSGLADISALEGQDQPNFQHATGQHIDEMMAWLVAEGEPWAIAMSMIPGIRRNATMPREQAQSRVRAAYAHDPLSAFELYLLALACDWQDLYNWCTEFGVFRQLHDTAPDNVLAHFASMRGSGIQPDNGVMSTQSNLDLLIGSQAASHADNYVARGLPIYIDAIRRFHEHQGVSGTSVEIVLDLESFTLIEGDATAKLRGLCSAVRREHGAAVDACLHAFDLLDATGNEDLQWAAAFERAGLIGRTEHCSPDWLYWDRRARLIQEVQECRRVSYKDWEFTEERAGKLIRLYESGKVSVGAASLELKREEYRDSPELFEMNPDDCDRLLGADEETIQEVLGQRDPLQIWERTCG